METSVPPALGKETNADEARPRPPYLASTTPAPSMRLTDKYGRAITDLRVSITDHCNYKCVYCRTGTEGALYADLPFQDYLRMVRVFVSLGIEKIRITGGEPLLRKGVIDFVRELSKLRTAFHPDGTAAGDEEPADQESVHEGSLHEGSLHEGSTDRRSTDCRPAGGSALDIAVTTNGHLLAEMAQPLKDAGLNRVTISMDAVDRAAFARITRVENGYDHVLAGIRAAKKAGLDPVKVNAVLLRGFNDDQIVEFAKFSRDEGVVVRFIEFMPLGEDRVWSPEIVVTMDEILAKLNEFLPVRQLPQTTKSETACRFTFADGVGEMGIIAPVSRPFCGHCSRVRLTSDGKIRTCLFSQMDHDLYAVMLRGGTDHHLATYISGVIQKKEARHHIGEADFQKPSRSMVHIGG